jgi:HSP20 family protein
MAISPAFNRAPVDPFARLFDTLLSNGGTSTSANLMRAPETDVIETEREIRVVTEMPGLKPGDIEIEVENNVLTLRGEKREERVEGEDGKYHLAERRYGTFTRSFVLPRDVDADSIKANFDNGVLSVVIPKSERARRRRIEVAGNHESAAMEGAQTDRQTGQTGQTGQGKEGGNG